LIYPNNKLKKFLITGDPKDAGDVAKIYVAVTRAQQKHGIRHSGQGEVAADADLCTLKLVTAAPHY
jgi:hypothetical protein